MRAGVRGAVVITSVKTQNASSNPGDRNSLEIDSVPRLVMLPELICFSHNGMQRICNIQGHLSQEKPVSEEVKATHPSLLFRDHFPLKEDRGKLLRGVKVWLFHLGGEKLIDASDGYCERPSFL